MSFWTCSLCFGASSCKEESDVKTSSAPCKEEKGGWQKFNGPSGTPRITVDSLDIPTNKSSSKAQSPGSAGETVIHVSDPANIDPLSPEPGPLAPTPQGQRRPAPLLQPHPSSTSLPSPSPSPIPTRLSQHILLDGMQTPSPHNPHSLHSPIPPSSTTTNPASSPSIQQSIPAKSSPSKPTKTSPSLSPNADASKGTSPGIPSPGSPIEIPPIQQTMASNASTQLSLPVQDPSPHIPTLDLDPLAAARKAAHNPGATREYHLTSSVPGTTDELSATNTALQTSPSAPTTAEALPSAVSLKPSGPSVPVPSPLNTIDATKSLEPKTASQLKAPAPPPPEPSPPLSDSTNKPPPPTPQHSATSRISAYAEVEYTADMTTTVGEATEAFYLGGPRNISQPDGMRHTSLPTAHPGSPSPEASRAESAPDLPPGAIVRGRDPLLDRLDSKMSHPTTSEMQMEESTMGTRVPAQTDSAADTIPTGPLHPSYSLAEDVYGNSAAFSEASDWTLSNTKTMTPSSRPVNSRMQLYTSHSNYPDSVVSGMSGTMFSEASNWTLSKPSPLNSTALSMNTFTPPESSATGMFSEASDWTLSSAQQRPGSRPGSARVPQQFQNSRITNASAGTGWSSRMSNWTLSGASRTVASGASRPLDDGKSVAFTEGGSDWQLSPRSTVVRDDLEIGGSQRWMQEDDIVVPDRINAQGQSLRSKFVEPNEGKGRGGLREHYAVKPLRQKFAADDANVPEAAYKRVDDWMGDLRGTRREVMKRIAQGNDI